MNTIACFVRYATLTRANLIACESGLTASASAYELDQNGKMLKLIELPGITNNKMRPSESFYQNTLSQKFISQSGILSTDLVNVN